MATPAKAQALQQSKGSSGICARCGNPITSSLTCIGNTPHITVSKNKQSPTCAACGQPYTASYSCVDGEPHVTISKNK